MAVMQGKPVERQIFVGGCSRSGTTLLGAMIGTHTRVICTPESHFKIDVLRSPANKNGRVDIQEAYDIIRRHWRFRLWEFDLDEIPLPPPLLQEAYGCLLSTLMGAYAHHQNRRQADIWVDHTPENLSYAYSLSQLFPDAKFVHIVRDGRAVAASIMPLDWGPNSIFKASRWWIRMVSFGLSAETFLGPDKVRRVRYEDLVRQPHETLRDLCDFLEINYQPEMVEATGFTPPRYTTGQHTFVGEKPDPEVATRWQRKLTPRQIEVFEFMTRDFLADLGYPLQYGFAAKGPTFWELQQGKAVELFQGEILNKFKWLKRSYPLWLTRDFYSQARISDTNN